MIKETKSAAQKKAKMFLSPSKSPLTRNIWLWEWQGIGIMTFGLLLG
jgi:hypothetical protein